MPVLSLKTNVKIDDKRGFIRALSDVVSKAFNKPAASICIDIVFDADMYFGGAFEPGVILHCGELGLRADANERYSAAIFQFVKESLGLESDRMYLIFYDPGADFLGYKGTTIGALRRG